MNPRSVKQKVAVGKISGLGGVDMFHFLIIPKSWCKIDVKEVLQPNVPLMFPKEDADQSVVKDVKGGNTIWNSECLQFTTWEVQGAKYDAALGDVGEVAWNCGLQVGVFLNALFCWQTSSVQVAPLFESQLYIEEKIFFSV